MLNTSVMDNNSTFNSFSFTLCLSGASVGMVVACVSVTLCFFLGTPANSWLLWLYLRVGWKIKPTQIFSINETILELIFCIQCAIEMINALIFNSDPLWKVIFFLTSLSWVGIPLMQICISVEQYLAVLHPITFLKYKGLQYRIAITAVVWLIVFFCAVHVNFIDIFSDRIFTSVFFISVIIISFCCVSVLRALKHPGPGDSQNPMERCRDVGNQQKRNAFNTIFTGLLIILITYLPQASLSFINITQIDKKLFTCNIVPIINSFNILGMMIRPLLKMYKKCCMKCFLFVNN